MNTYYKNKTARTGQAGFTLVELSIVLVIIGFLIAGIAAATNMVKQAELRSVMSDLRTYATAYNNFIGKYNAVPGDWNAAASVFGATNCTASNTCDGDNDGLIEFSTTSADNEVKQAMRVLGLSGFINGNFDADPADSVSVVGVNAPPSKVSGAGYVIASGTIGLTTDLGFNVSQNYLLMGKADGAGAGTLINGALTPSDTHNLDSKMDDGNIDTSGDFIGATSGSLMASDASDAAADECATNAGVYTVATTSNACVLGFSLN